MTERSSICPCDAEATLFVANPRRFDADDIGSSFFATSSDPDFAEFMSHLTNGLDERIMVLLAFGAHSGMWTSVELRVDDFTNNSAGVTFIFHGAPVPEPATALLLAAGLMGLGARRRVAS